VHDCCEQTIALRVAALKADEKMRKQTSRKKKHSSMSLLSASEDDLHAARLMAKCRSPAEAEVTRWMIEKAGRNPTRTNADDISPQHRRRRRRSSGVRVLESSTTGLSPIKVSVGASSLSLANLSSQPSRTTATAELSATASIVSEKFGAIAAVLRAASKRPELATACEDVALAAASLRSECQ
jgi:hypothetical protein